ncbi:MAG: hypothetical protein K2N04_07180 [Alistipes sp.]|nr:hypothetical protein [Alistipes sp.]
MNELANGSKSLYLDICRNGKRSYENLRCALFSKRTIMLANEM